MANIMSYFLLTEGSLGVCGVVLGQGILMLTEYVSCCKKHFVRSFPVLLLQISKL